MVTDPLEGIERDHLSTRPPSPVGGLVTGTATYAVTQADIDAGFVYNLATADSDESPPDTDDNNEPLPQDPKLNIVKDGTFDAGADGFADVGELITYTFVVTNTGNVTLHNVVVTDPLEGIERDHLSTRRTIPVGGFVTGTATYAVTQADIDAGFVYNLATADSDESPPDTDDNNEPLPQDPKLNIVKDGVWVDGDNDGYAAVGDVINYTVTVQNTGNQTLTGITVTDPRSRTSPTSRVTPTTTASSTSARPGPTRAATPSPRSTSTPAATTTWRLPTPTRLRLTPTTRP